MSSINFNQLTREIELKGLESFIESNFNMIQDLLIESFGVKKEMTAARKTKQEFISVVKVKESQVGAEIKRDVLPEAPSVLPVSTSAMPEISHEAKVKREPLRKYIRKVGEPGHERIVVEVAEQKAKEITDHERIVVEVAEQKVKEITLESLKEKFGLTGNRTSGIFRDAERFGNTRRSMNGSYLWAQG